MATFTLDISTPEKRFFTGEAESIVLSTLNGEIGVLAGHVPALVALSVAPMKIKTNGDWREAAISGGFAEITDKNVWIMADAAEWPEEIELGRAMEAKRRAEERMLSRQSETDYMRTLVALQRALTRINVASGSKSGVR